ncbi:hypothetical protein [Actinoplanes xinjiangensis]|uniref:hypothetical protein n=1 Tax=Actinoplanes xinjiangensis TaxID=512350 RepID=UPI00342ED86B
MTIMFVALGVLAVSGCWSEPSAVPPTGSASPGAGPSATSPAPTSPSPTGPSSTSPAPTEDVTRASPPSTGEVPGGLPHGRRSVTGVVERSGDCTLLRVGGRYWELTGTLAGTLTDRSTVTVTGPVTTATGCAGKEVVRAIVVAAVLPR